MMEYPQLSHSRDATTRDRSVIDVAGTQRNAPGLTWLEPAKNQRCQTPYYNSGTVDDDNNYYDEALFFRNSVAAGISPVTSDLKKLSMYSLESSVSPSLYNYGIQMLDAALSAGNANHNETPLAGTADFFSSVSTMVETEMDANPVEALAQMNTQVNTQAPYYNSGAGTGAGDDDDDNDNDNDNDNYDEALFFRNNAAAGSSPVTGDSKKVSMYSLQGSSSASHYKYGMQMLDSTKHSDTPQARSADFFGRANSMRDSVSTMVESEIDADSVEALAPINQVNTQVNDHAQKILPSQYSEPHREVYNGVNHSPISCHMMSQQRYSTSYSDGALYNPLGEASSSQTASEDTSDLDSLTGSEHEPTVPSPERRRSSPVCRHSSASPERYSRSNRGSKSEGARMKKRAQTLPSDLIFTCRFCSKTYTRQNRLRKHIESKHNGQSLMYKCKQCQKAYTSRENLNRHMNVHTERYKCPHCGLAHDRAKRFEKHVARCFQNPNAEK